MFSSVSGLLAEQTDATVTTVLVCSCGASSLCPCTCPSYQALTLILTLQVVMAYTVALAVFIFAFWHSPNIAWVQWLAVAAVGAALYGPQVINIAKWYFH